MSKLISKILKESMYDSKGNFYGGPDPNEEDYNETSPTTFTTKMGEEIYTITYYLQCRASGIKREQKFVSADIVKVVNKKTGKEEKDLSFFQFRADKHGKDEIAIGNESQYGI